ncbi:MAG: hypothetical protein ABSG65_33390, partial [Bryobacteraceae bacterium]|jgi:hypothetical protein
VLLGSLAGEHLRHLGDGFTGVEEALRERKLPPAAQRDDLQKMLAEHYERWVDMPVPALNGKTPREAAANPESRTQLGALLKMMQNGEEHKRRDGFAWFDVSKLKAELGIEF